MLRLRVALTSYVGRCRYCRRAIVGKGKTASAQWWEQTYNGVATQKEMPMRCLRWHPRCFAKMVREEQE